MAEIMLTTGLVCIVAAIVGGGLSAKGFTFPMLNSRLRQVMLGVFGLVLALAALPRSPAPSRGDDGSSPAAVDESEAPRVNTPAASAAPGGRAVSAITGIELPGKPEFLPEDPADDLYLLVRSTCSSFARERGRSLEGLEAVAWIGSSSSLNAIQGVVMDELLKRGYAEFSDRNSGRWAENFNGYIPDAVVELTAGSGVVGFTWSGTTKDYENWFRIWAWCKFA